MTGPRQTIRPAVTKVNCKLERWREYSLYEIIGSVGYGQAAVRNVILLTAQQPFQDSRSNVHPNVPSARELELRVKEKSSDCIRPAP
mmetsp:Transcript_50223/g.151190  ORF Transcript_50223/g.151190 Transcript_50223/m.151190 type:complete len:87 (+) Transcript_50223:538-798(+)